MSNPGQETSHCRLSGALTCHAACKVGCTASNDPTKCTTPYNRSKGKKPNPCQRCASGYHPVGASSCVINTPGTPIGDCKNP